MPVFIQATVITKASLVPVVFMVFSTTWPYFIPDNNNMWNDESAALYCTHQKKNEGKKAPTNSKTQQGKTVSQIISKGNNDIPKDAGS